MLTRCKSKQSKKAMQAQAKAGLYTSETTKESEIIYIL